MTDNLVMTDDQEDAGILAAARALAFAQRPALSGPIGAPVEEYSPEEWWRTLSERDQRIMLYRARAAVSAWEDWCAMMEKGESPLTVSDDILQRVVAANACFEAGMKAANGEAQRKLDRLIKCVESAVNTLSVYSPPSGTQSYRVWMALRSALEDVRRVP